MSTRATVAAIIVAKDEAANIVRCLDSLSWCDERVVIDDHSSDATAELARQHGARVLTHKFESFARQRNWAITEGDLQSDWLLLLDADEVSTPEFATAVRKAADSATTDTVAFRTCRKTMLLGRWLKYSDGFPVWIMRVVRRGQPLFADAGHGEVPVPSVPGQMGVISEPFLHFAFSKGLSDWLNRHNRYSTREAHWEFQSQSSLRLGPTITGDRSARRKALRDLGRRLPCRPAIRFLYQYVLKLGFLDGRAGFIFCMLMAWYEWLIGLKRRELELQAQGVEL